MSILRGKLRGIAILVIALVIGMVFLSGCADAPPDPSGAPGAGGSGTQVDNATQAYQNGLNLNNSTYGAEMGRTEVNQGKLDTNQPAPVSTNGTSNTRENLVKRMHIVHDPNHLFYIYLIDYGHVMDVEMAHGIPQSVNSLLTSPTQILSDPANHGGEYSGNIPSIQVPSPDMDGTYGQNGPNESVFFWNTAGHYIEWHGDYEVSDSPFSLAEQPEMIRTVQ